MIARFPHLIKCSISHTTRIPRKNELNGRDYYFTSKKEMENMIKNNLFIEYDRLYDQIYGTSFKTLNDIRGSGCVPIIEVSVHGMQHILTHKELSCNYLYIVPPSIEILRRRLIDRHSETEAMIDLRMKNVCSDMLYGYENTQYVFLLFN